MKNRRLLIAHTLSNLLHSVVLVATKWWPFKAKKRQLRGVFVLKTCPRFRGGFDALTGK